MKYICGILVAVLFVTSGRSTPIQKCKEGADPVALRVQGCNSLPCSLTRGSNITAELDFVTPVKTNTLTARVRATAFGVTITYPLPMPDGCLSLRNATCPLKQGQKVTNVQVIPILKEYPRIPVTIEFSFLDDTKKAIVCYKLPIRIR